MPSSVLILQNSQRGATRNVSIATIFIAPLPSCVLHDGAVASGGTLELLVVRGGLVEQSTHGQVGCRRIAGAHRLEHRAVRRDGSAASGCECTEHVAQPQALLDDVLEAAEQHVVRGVEQSGMEGEVGLHDAGVVLVRVHRQQGRVEQLRGRRRRGGGRRATAAAGSTIRRTSASWSSSAFVGWSAICQPSTSASSMFHWSRGVTNVPRFCRAPTRPFAPAP